MRIDELAQRAGTTSRNIRAYQARGLIPAPTLRGRTGYYGEEHLRRLEMIDQLQARGFSLEAVRHTLDAWSAGGDLGHLIGFHHVLTAPWTNEQPGSMTGAELLERFPEAAGAPALIEQAIELGLIVARDDGGYDVPSPMLIDAGTELVRAGIPLVEIHDLVRVLRSDLADIAQRFVDLVARNLVEPIAEGGASAEEIDAVAKTVERLRPVAMEVVRPFLAQELRRAVDASLTAFATRLPPAPPPGPSPEAPA